MSRKESVARYRLTPKGRCNSLLTNARFRARKGGYECTLTPEWALDRMNAGVCEVSGLPFTMLTDETYGTRNNAHPYSPTLDKIDPAKGYTPENTQMVVAVYNYAKMHWGHEHVVALSKAILKGENV